MNPQAPNDERGALAENDERSRLADADERIALAGLDESIVLAQEGLRFRWPAFLLPRLRIRTIRYADITHFAVISWGIWLATRRGLYAFRRSRFAETDGPERLERALVRAIARRSGGLEQLSRIAHVQNLARHGARLRAARWVAVVCIAIYLLQLRDPFVEVVGSLTPPLVMEGQLWRFVTANLLHGISIIPVHLIFNMLGLMGLAMLVERPLGAAATLVIMGSAGLCAMATSFVMTPDAQVIGASGMVMGLAGAALSLELHFSSRLPAWWRIPRKPFFVVLCMQAYADWVLPFTAGWAHLGGFVGGYLTTLVVARSAIMGDTRGGGWIRGAARGFVLATLATVAFVAPVLLRDAAALERYALQVLAAPDLGLSSDNNLAWRMATETDASPEQLEVALELAKRAVDRTDFEDPEMLDTLAEVFFKRGQQQEAIRVIDEAIRLDQGETYYREQRRRFMGERAADDRPEPPMLPWGLKERERIDEGREPGIII